MPSGLDIEAKTCSNALSAKSCLVSRSVDALLLMGGMPKAAGVDMAVEVMPQQVDELPQVVQVPPPQRLCLQSLSANLLDLRLPRRISAATATRRRRTANNDHYEIH
jgi:DNA-binding LytR/AlgR family response regulator